MLKDIDLIPASYRERLKIQRWCHIFFAALIAISGLTVVLKVSLNNKNNALQEAISNLQRDKSFNLQQQQTYNNLLSTERLVNKNLEILNGLRGGPSVRHILQIFDRVITDNVWFSQWSFKRAGVFTETRPETVQTGYFIIIPQENSNNGKPQTWKLDTHMEIRGQAIDHSSLSTFVQALLQQTEISDVKVENTQVRSYVDTQVIDFSLVIIINNKPRN